MDIDAINANIVQVPADGLITAFHPNELLIGKIDSAIQHVAGVIFHNQLNASLQVSPDSEVFVVNDNQARHMGTFQNVVFVVDNPREPLSVIIRRALTVASTGRMKSVTIPLIRLGSRSTDATAWQVKVEDIAQALVDQAVDADNQLESVTVVCYEDDIRLAYLRHLLHLD